MRASRLLLSHNLQVSPVCPGLSCTLLPLLIKQKNTLRARGWPVSGVVISFPHCLLEKLSQVFGHGIAEGKSWVSPCSGHLFSALWTSAVDFLHCLICFPLSLAMLVWGSKLFYRVVANASYLQAPAHSAGKAACSSSGLWKQAVVPRNCSLQLSHKPLQLFRAGVGIIEQGSAMGGGQGDSAPLPVPRFFMTSTLLWAWNSLFYLVDQMSLWNAFFSSVFVDSALTSSVSVSSILD